eukprot:EG_transcript_8526
MASWGSKFGEAFSLERNFDFVQDFHEKANSILRTPLWSGGIPVGETGGGLSPPPPGKTLGPGQGTAAPGVGDGQESAGQGAGVFCPTPAGGAPGVDMVRRGVFANPVDKKIFSPENTDNFDGTASSNLAEDLNMITETGSAGHTNRICGNVGSCSPRLNMVNRGSFNSVGEEFSKSANLNSSESVEISNSQSQTGSDTCSEISNADFSGGNPENVFGVNMITASPQESQGGDENQLVQWTGSPPQYQSDSEIDSDRGSGLSQFEETEQLLVAAGWIPPRFQIFGPNQFPNFGAEIPQIEGVTPILLLEDRGTASHSEKTVDGQTFFSEATRMHSESKFSGVQSANLGCGASSSGVINLAASKTQVEEDEEMEPQPPDLGVQVGGADISDWDAWDNWAQGVDCQLAELNRSLTHWESIIPPQVVVENRLENFERELGEKNSRAQAELLHFIQENVERRNAEICSQFEEQKQKSQQAIQQAVSQFISQC